MAVPTSGSNAGGIGANRGKGRVLEPAMRAGPGQSSETSSKRKGGLFSKELKSMMYGFGDNSEPVPETVQLAEDILVDYIRDMIHKAQELASTRGKMTIEDIMILIRKDPMKFSRVKYLLDMDGEMKRTKKDGFDLDEIVRNA